MSTAARPEVCITLTLPPNGRKVTHRTRRIPPSGGCSGEEASTAPRRFAFLSQTDGASRLRAERPAGAGGSLAVLPDMPPCGGLARRGQRRARRRRLPLPSLRPRARGRAERPAAAGPRGLYALGVRAAREVAVPRADEDRAVADRVEDADGAGG